MSKTEPTSPQILNANELASGDVVYWSGNGWVADIRAAQLVTDPEAATAIGAREIAAQKIVDPYLIDVAITPQGPWPKLYREQVRAAGPSIRPDLGKQAQFNNRSAGA